MIQFLLPIALASHGSLGARAAGPRAGMLDTETLAGGLETRPYGYADHRSLKRAGAEGDCGGLETRPYGYADRQVLLPIPTPFAKTMYPSAQASGSPPACEVA